MAKFLDTLGGSEAAKQQLATAKATTTQIETNNGLELFTPKEGEVTTISLFPGCATFLDFAVAELGTRATESELIQFASEAFDAQMTKLGLQDRDSTELPEWAMISEFGLNVHRLHFMFGPGMGRIDLGSLPGWETMQTIKDIQSLPSKFAVKDKYSYTMLAVVHDVNRGKRDDDGMLARALEGGVHPVLLELNMGSIESLENAKQALAQQGRALADSHLMVSLEDAQMKRLSFQAIPQTPIWHDARALPAMLKLAKEIGGAGKHVDARTFEDEADLRKAYDKAVEKLKSKSAESKKD